MGYGNAKIEHLLGSVIARIEGLEVGSDDVVFELGNGDKYRMFHDQDCCECVLIKQIDGDVNDLIGNAITMAEEVENPESALQPEDADSYTWTFYKLATVKGYVTIQWLGESNGYYSESVDFDKINP